MVAPLSYCNGGQHDTEEIYSVVNERCERPFFHGVNEWCTTARGGVPLCKLHYTHIVAKVKPPGLGENRTLARQQRPVSGTHHLDQLHICVHFVNIINSSVILIFGK